MLGLEILYSSFFTRSGALVLTIHHNKYNELAKDRTSIYISHRLASTRFCDRIILIDNGAVAESGTHAELVIAGGKYSELFEIQSKYYKENDGGEI